MDDETLSDEALVRLLPGDFENGSAEVNGTALHYVIGGEGSPVVLLPGWPQTWWAFRKVMPALARRHNVVAVDLRGMGGSARPEGGYDKKTMAVDIRELIRHLGHEKADLVGHDIGAMVAYSLAANHPEVVGRLALLDVTHPHEGFGQLVLLPRPGQKVNPDDPPGGPRYRWWFAFNQVRGLPEQLVTGRARHLVDWLVEYSAVDPGAIDDRDRAVYAAAYSEPDAIRAGNGWYRAFGQDIADEKGYGKLSVPVLMLAGVHSYAELKDVLPRKAAEVTVLPVEHCGHYMAEERPEAVVELLTEFLG